MSAASGASSFYIRHLGPELIREAAKEAVKIADLLVVCGFAFDPLAGEEASALGRLTILQERMNPDLTMADELLKKTGSGNPSRGKIAVKVINHYGDEVMKVFAP